MIAPRREDSRTFFTCIPIIDDTSCYHRSSGELSSSFTLSVRKLNEDNTSRSDKILVDFHAPLMSHTSCTLLLDLNDKLSKLLQPKSVFKQSDARVEKLDTPSLDLGFSGILKVAYDSLSPIETQPNDNNIDSYKEEDGLKVQHPTQRREATIEPKEISSILNLPSKDEESLLLDLKNFHLDEKFFSSMLSEPRITLHLEAIKRHRNLLSKSCVQKN